MLYHGSRLGEDELVVQHFGQIFLAARENAVVTICQPCGKVLTH